MLHNSARKLIWYIHIHQIETFLPNFMFQINVNFEENKKSIGFWNENTLQWCGAICIHIFFEYIILSVNYCQNQNLFVPGFSRKLYKIENYSKDKILNISSFTYVPFLVIFSLYEYVSYIQFHSDQNYFPVIHFEYFCRTRNLLHKCFYVTYGELSF